MGCKINRPTLYNGIALTKNVMEVFVLLWFIIVNTLKSQYVEGDILRNVTVLIFHMGLFYYVADNIWTTF